MKTENNILIAFLLNLFFAAFEFFGGIITGSIAIISDSIHDIGDAAGIGISWLLEKKSKNSANDIYTYGYARYSVLGSLITTTILIVGSLLVIYNSVLKILTPCEINYDGMIIFAIVGVTVNSVAAFFTHASQSLNQKAVHLHMLEDVLGWIIVLVGATFMKFTHFTIIDPIMSIGVAGFITINAMKNLKIIFDIFLEKTPTGINLGEIKMHLSEIDGVSDIHHIHIWSLDTENNIATMHVVCDNVSHNIKDIIRQELKEHGIPHATIELESSNEHCHEKNCHIECENNSSHHHHHH